MTIASRIDHAANAGLLIQQWRESPRMMALTGALMGVVHELLVKPLDQMERQTRIDTAEGFCLDQIGERLGQPRPAVTASTDDFPIFGFDGSGGLGFGQGLFDTVHPELSPRVPVGDAFYRVALRMRAGSLLQDGSVPSMEGVVRQDFPEASYEDEGDMTATLHISDTRTQLLNLLSELEAWPRPGGVALTVDTS